MPPPAGRSRAPAHRVPPARFAAAYPLDKIPIEEELLNTSAREDLRHAIADAQNVLAEQVTAIHAEFERAFATYREIDTIVEERSVVAASAKAA